MLIVGVDGCPGGWIAVSRGPYQETKARVFTTADALLNQTPRPDVLAIDIPIGLPEFGPRACDILARSMLGGRRSSVFPAPLRPMLTAATYEEACRIRSDIEGKKISKQTWGIMKKIGEVDRALVADPSLHTWVHEVHPEVCFTAWNRGKPMTHAKKIEGGHVERRALVDAYFGPEAYASVRKKFLKKVAADDDILDSFVALWTAERIATGKAQVLPETPPLDRAGLRMEIVY